MCEGGGVFTGDGLKGFSLEVGFMVAGVLSWE